MIIHATNIHTGGGKVLLDEILRGEIFGPCTVALLDERYAIPADGSCGQVVRVAPSLFSRLRSEWELRRLSRAMPAEDVLCFGNLPPLFRLRSNTILFLQNAFLLPAFAAPRDSLKTFLRIVYEKAWFRLFARHADRILVQTRWMRDRLPPGLQGKAEIRVILPRLPDRRRDATREYLFLAVTGNERHKRLDLLLDALRRVDLKGHRVAIVSSGRCAYPLTGLEASVDLHQGLSREQVLDLYQKSRCLVMTSEIESFCLPLYEARHFGLDVIAPGCGFVLEALTPQITVADMAPDQLAEAMGEYLSRTAQLQA